MASKNHRKCEFQQAAIRAPTKGARAPNLKRKKIHSSFGIFRAPNCRVRAPIFTVQTAWFYWFLIVRAPILHFGARFFAWLFKQIMFQNQNTQNLEYKTYILEQGLWNHDGKPSKLIVNPSYMYVFSYFVSYLVLSYE